MGSAKQQSSLKAPAKPKPAATADEPGSPSKSSGITSPGATETIKLMLLFFGGQGSSGDGGASVITASE